VHATLADRDKISADDNVQVLLARFTTSASLRVWGQPVGVQMDGTIVETGQTTGGTWTPTLSGRAAPDLSQDFVFTSKGHLTEYGYEVEIRVPFKSMKFQSGDQQSWDVNVVRQVQHSGYEDSWRPRGAPTPPSSARVGRSRDSAASIAVWCSILNPVVTRKASGAATPRVWGYTHPRPQFGANVRWG